MAFFRISRSCRSTSFSHHSHAVAEKVLHLGDGLDRERHADHSAALLFPAAEQIVIEAQVTRYLRDAQATFGDQAHCFAFKPAAVLFAFDCFVLNCHYRSCGFSLSYSTVHISG